MARFGKYELLGKIGEGGMAELHLARASGAFGTEKLLVLKRLLPELGGTERFRGMFLDEARLALRLNHANIVQVYEADEHEGVAFYVMEFLHGRDVRELMREAARRDERLPLEASIAVVLSTCAALHYAHELCGPDGRSLGVVHRDVSPHNVFVLQDGLVKVIDFGIAKVAAGAERTATGMLKGKFGYMSPEQCLQQPLDRRSDVFGVGILLWELTTGQRLYKAPSEYQMVKATVEAEAAAPSGAVAGYPPALEAIVMKALKRDRAARHPTARALGMELEAFARQAGLDLSPGALARCMDRFAGTDARGARLAALGGRVAGGADAAAGGGGAGGGSGGATAEGRGEAAGAGWLLPAEAQAGDETKSAAVTETLVPERGRRSRAAAVAVAGAMAMVAAGALLFGRGEAPGSAPGTEGDVDAGGEVVAPGPAVAAPSGEGASSAAASSEAAAGSAAGSSEAVAAGTAPGSSEAAGASSATASATAAAAAGPRPVKAKAGTPSKGAPAAKPKAKPRAASPDPDAPLPR